MSKHKSRKERWQELSDRRYESEDGKVFPNREGKWSGRLASGISVGDNFKRARNAQMAVEEKATMLRTAEGKGKMAVRKLMHKWALNDLEARE